MNKTTKILPWVAMIAFALLVSAATNRPQTVFPFEIGKAYDLRVRTNDTGTRIGIITAINGNWIELKIGVKDNTSLIWINADHIAVAMPYYDHQE